MSSRIVDHPGAMVGLNAYAATKAALEAHTLNLAAELAGTRRHGQRLPSRLGRHGHAGMDPQPTARRSARPCTTASRPPRAGRADHPGALRRSLLARLAGVLNGEIWSVNDA